MRVTRKENGKLDITRYPNLTITCALGPTHVKRGVFTTVPDKLHSRTEPEGGGEPAFIHACHGEWLSSSAAEPRRRLERPPTVHLPYAAGINWQIRRLCRDFNIRVVFKSGLQGEASSNKCHAPAERCTSARLNTGSKHV